MIFDTQFPFQKSFLIQDATLMFFSKKKKKMLFRTFEETCIETFSSTFYLGKQHSRSLSLSFSLEKLTNQFYEVKSDPGYSEMIENSEECDKMFNQVDDGKWDISDDDVDDIRSDSEKE